MLTLTLVLTIGLYAFENLAITTLMPAVAREFDSFSLYGAAFSAYLLASVVSLVMGGSGCDRKGPFFVLAIGLVLFAAGSLGAALAQNMASFVAARALQGAGGGAMFSAAYVGVALGYRQASHARMFALLAGAWVLPSFVAPALAGLITEHAGWRVVFIGVLPFPLLILVVGAVSMPRVQPAPENGRHWRLYVAALSVAIGVVVVLGGTDTEAHMPTGLRVALTVVGTCGLAVGLPRLLPLGTLLARPGVPAAVLTRGMLALAFLAGVSFTPLALKELRGEGLAAVGAILALPSISWTAAAYLHARYHEGFSARVAITAGSVATAVGLAACWPALGWDYPLSLLYFGWFVAGAGMGLAFNATTVFTVANANVGQEGRAMAGLQLTEPLGAAIGTGIGGLLLTIGSNATSPSSQGFAFVWIFLVLVALGSCAVAQRVGGRAESNSTGSAL